MRTTRCQSALPLLLTVVLSGALVPAALGQAPAIVEDGYRNVFVIPPRQTVDPGGVEAPPTGDPLLPAYQVQGESGTAFGGFTVNGFGTLQGNTDETPPVYDATAVPYPISSPNAAGDTFQLRSVRFARPLALFATNYQFGDVIPPPEKISETTGEPEPGFYREEPLNARIRTPIDADGNPTGEPVEDADPEDDPDGDGVHVAGGKRYAVGPNPNFYWSKHSEKVYATQPGAIVIRWREEGTTTVREETYVIATTPSQPERTIYWTEDGFDAPLVDVPAGRVTDVNIVYNSIVPKEVVEPYDPPWLPGLVDFTVENDEDRRYKTFYFENNLFHAYNVQGRVFLEYLGVPRGDGTNEPKGIEVVNVVKEAVPSTIVVDLGEQLNQVPLSDGNGVSIRLEPEIFQGIGLGGDPYIHQHVFANGTETTLYAIRETQPGISNQNKTLNNTVLVYWMETSLLEIQWPRQFVGYIQQWPGEISEYSVYARPDSRAAGGRQLAEDTAVQLDAANNPALVYQDDLFAPLQAVLNPQQQFYTLVNEDEPTNRALLRFTVDDDIWFERVFSQLDPYIKDLRHSVTGTVDGGRMFDTQFVNISDVTVTDTAAGIILVEGVDYTVDLSTGVITFLDSADGGAANDVSVTFNPAGTPTRPFATVPGIVNWEIGERIIPSHYPEADSYGEEDPVFVGYINEKSGTAYNVNAYRNPFELGFEEAARGAIIGINDLAGNDQLEVWWYRQSEPAGDKISGTFWPSFVQKYRLNWPAQPGEIVLASNKGSDDLPSLQAKGSIYTQNDATKPGYNPNEEHALMLNGRAWALRDDLNQSNSSQPFVLLEYTAADQRPAMEVFWVSREKDVNFNDSFTDPEDISFHYPAIAGKILQAPMPLPLLPAPILPEDTTLGEGTLGNGDSVAAGKSASYEVAGTPDPHNTGGTFDSTDSAFAHYQKFTWEDRKGTSWVYRGPHQGNAAAGPPTFKMRYFYKTLPGFHFPSESTQPPVGTITPYLRAFDGTSIDGFRGHPVTGKVTAGVAAQARAEQPLDVTFVPQWPVSAPTLRIGETLTLPKVGLPQVRGQESAEIVYQQSVALDTGGGDLAARKSSARLFDPTRSKIYYLGGPAWPAGDNRSGNLAAIPDSVHTSVYLGKTYFPGLPPHLSTRLYFDPAVGHSGALILKGVFMDELFGEKYLQLNVLGERDVTAAKALVPDSSDKKSEWDAAIDGLATTMETFVENPARKGTFEVLGDPGFPGLKLPPITIDGTDQEIDLTQAPFFKTAPLGTDHAADERPPVPAARITGPPAIDDLAEVFHSDTAVDSYAISASGGGRGYVVVAMGNGRNTNITSADGPVSLEVFKVEAPLYRGQLKVIPPQNPLDEKLTVQHTGDFAGHPEEYDFEWRYAPPVDGLPLRVYSFSSQSIVRGSGATWHLIHDPLSGYESYQAPGDMPADVVNAVALTNAGAGYATMPEAQITGGSGSGAKVKVSGELDAVSVGSGGSGYTQLPAVTFSGGGGTGAAATANVSAGVVTSVTITNRGRGYTSAPTVSFTGGGGSGAQGTAALRVESLTLTNGGIGFAGGAVPTVTFSGGSPTASAQATATIGKPALPPFALNGPANIIIDDGNGDADHGVTSPNALLRGSFSIPANAKSPLRSFLSLDLAPNDGAVVYLNGAKVAAYRAPGHDDTPTTGAPATRPALAPLSYLFEISPDALNINGVTDGNVFSVELYTASDAGTVSSFDIKLEGMYEVENLTGWLPLTAEGDVASTVSTQNVDASAPFDTGLVSVRGKNRHVIEGSSLLTLSDNYIIMRYRARESTNAAHVANGGWSKWTEPQLAEGWIKRVLAGINPFQQRIKDLFNHEINTSVSLVEQAGTRWEGNIALNLDNVNDAGLIEIYETVLNRGRDISIDGNPGINYGGANDALLLAAGYINDLYMILGNDAYADAANPTIAFNTEEGKIVYGDVATALFSFKGQLATVLEEELALLRGRDDFLLPGTRTAPVYNRLVWNYTRGIDSGEAIYALNYNIKDRTWDLSINPNNPSNEPIDGIISAADAAISFPQGHGDAYGHYLTALSGYYNLLNNANFTWTPRIEAVLVLGQPVSVDYQDERKFASAAAALSRTASQVLDLTYRQQYSSSDEQTWEHLEDEKVNPNTGLTRNWGTDDWACRGGQGALFHWVTANSLLPAVDPDPEHSGIQKIDRTTVPELAEISAQAAKIQETLDNADSRMNPLGLSPGALTFDISPDEIDAGKTHYEQIFGRATGALRNALSAFDNASASTQFLRRQEDTLADRRNAINAQEQAFTNELIEIYGTPYTDDIGPGKTYPQDYAGPDLLHSAYVEITETIGNFSDPAGTGGSGTGGAYLIYRNLQPAEIENLQTFRENISLGEQDTTDPDNPVPVSDKVEYRLDPISGIFIKPPEWSGRRVSPGKMQTAVSNFLLARQDLFDALYNYDRLVAVMDKQIDLYNSALNAHNATAIANNVHDIEIAIKEGLILALGATVDASNLAAEKSVLAGQIGKEALPLVAGFSNDVTSAARSSFIAAGAAGELAPQIASKTASRAIKGIEFAQNVIDRALATNLGEIGWAHENRQLLYGLRSTLQGFIDNQGPLDAALRRMDQAQRDLFALQAQGERVQKQRLVFRQHAAAIIQGYRTRDFAFRAFRDEALERYKALFDLSARYAYLAARAYDYETGLLDASGNASAAAFYEKIVQARALGVISGGQPQFAGSETGDPGLSGVLASLSGDWSVVRSRLGFNNADRYATTFSLREEAFRILPSDDGKPEPDLAWRDKLASFRMPNILDDPDVLRFCMQVGDPNASAVPGLVIPFSSTIATGHNFFGKPLAGGDHTFTPSSFSTKIRSSGIAFRGYVGMDSPTTTKSMLDGIGAKTVSSPNKSFSDPQALSATPYVYLIPVGADSMRAPPLGDTSTIRTWAVQDQAVPLPFNIANSDYSTQPAWVSAASLSEPAFTLRKHQAFRAVPAGSNFQSGFGFTNSRLIGRSAWNSGWKIVIPGYTLLNNPDLGIQIFVDTVKDIELHFETYSYSGN